MDVVIALIYIKNRHVLQDHDLTMMSEGTYHIQGDDVFLMIQKVAGETKESARAEYHKKMIDRHSHAYQQHRDLWLWLRWFMSSG